MAQKPVINVGIKIDELDQEDIQKMLKGIEPLISKMASIDPRIKDIKKQIVDLEKDKEKALKSEERMNNRINRIHSARERILERLNDSSRKASDLKANTIKSENNFNVATRKNQGEINKLLTEREQLEKRILEQRKSVTDINDTDSDLNKQLIKDEQKLSDLDNKISIKKIETENLLMKMSQDKNKAAEDTLKNAKEMNDLKEKADKFNKDEETTTAKIKELQDNRRKINDQIIEQEELKKNIEKEHYNYSSKSLHDQIKYQQDLAKQIMAKDKNISSDEALNLAKKLAPLQKDGIKLSKQDETLVSKSLKNKKLALKYDLDENKLKYKSGLIDRHTFKERQKELYREHQARKGLLGIGIRHAKTGEKTGVTGVVSDLAKGENVAEKMTGQLGALGQVIEKLIGPLLVLGGIAGFLMVMLEYNKKIKEAQKNILMLNASSGSAWKRIQQGEVMGVNAAEKFRASLRSLYDEAGITYEEAQKNVESLIKSSTAFNNVLDGNFSTLEKVHGMAVLTNMSFDEMSAISGEWVNQFRKSTGELTDTFTSLRNAAANSDFTTSRFFSSVMNAAQGLVIYSTRIEDVGNAFAYLAKGTKDFKMPQKEAEAFAASMLNATKTMSNQQKALISQIGNVEGVLGNERDKFEDLVKQGKKLSAADQTRLAQLQQLLNTTFPDQYERQVALFNAMNPSEQIETRVTAMVKKINSSINTADPTAMKEFFNTNMAKLMEVGETFGFSKENILGLKEFFNSGKTMSGLAAALTAGITKQEKAAEKRQINIITQGTKSIRDMLSEKIAHAIEEIYSFLQNYAAPFFDAVVGFFGKEAKQNYETGKEIAKKMSTLKAEISQIEDAEKTAKGPEKQQLKVQKAAKIAELQKLEAAKSNAAALGKSGVIGTVAGAILPSGLFTSKTAKNTAIMREAMLPQLNNLKTAIASAKFNDVTKRLADDMFRWISQPTNINDLYDKKFNNNKFILELVKVSELLAQTSKNPLNSDAVLNLFRSNLNFRQGGYTGDGKPTNAAGIVHKKEFVFDEVSTRKIGKDNLEKLMMAARNGFAASGYVGTASKLARSGFKIGSAIGTKAMGMTPTGMALQAGARIALPLAAKALGIEQKPGSTVNNNQSITINVNQRDRQEIEQIVYKVMYDKSGKAV